MRARQFIRKHSATFPGTLIAFPHPNNVRGRVRVFASFEIVRFDILLCNGLKRENVLFRQIDAKGEINNAGNVYIFPAGAGERVARHKLTGA